MITANLNESVPLQILAADGRTDLYGQVRVYTPSGTPVATINLTHLNEGLYSGNWVPNIEGYYSYVGELYFDSGHAQDAGYERSGDIIDVSTLKTNILRILGLHHENAVIDQQVYDGAGNLTSARVRCYDSKPNAQGAGLTGLQFIYAVSASYTNGQLSNYTMTREQ